MARRPTRALNERKERANRHASLDKSALCWTEDEFYEQLAQAEAPLLLVLDCVQDPHNLGACMRSADAAGVLAVIVPKDKSAVACPSSRVSCPGVEI